MIIKDQIYINGQEVSIETNNKDNGIFTTFKYGNNKINLKTLYNKKKGWHTKITHKRKQKIIIPNKNLETEQIGKHHCFFINEIIEKLKKAGNMENLVKI